MTYFRNTSELVNRTNLWCEENIEKFKAESIFLPAGKTPEPIYKAWEAEKPKWLDSLQLLQMDDVYNGVKKDMFQQFFVEHLPSYCQKVKTPIQSGGQAADLAILGLGKNGHVAFHEPGLPESFFYGVIELSEITKNHLGLERDAKGVTYGVGAFLQAKALLLIVSGEGKQQVFNEFLDGTSDKPVSFLAKHPNITLLIDQSIGKKQSHRGCAVASL